MAQSMEQHDHHACLQAFHHWMLDNSLSVGDPTKDPAFLPCEKLAAYFHANDLENLNNLLVAIYEGEETQLTAKEILGQYSAVFCILVRIGKIKFLPCFVDKENLNDVHLPFTPTQRPSTFPIDANDTDFFDRFCAEQWRFCPPLMNATSKAFEKDRVLPFTSKAFIAEGASADIYKITIHSAYNYLTDLGKSTSTFALKTYKGHSAEKTWSREVRAFEKLRDTNTTDIIGFYTAFKHGDMYNIILEYADKGTLAEFLRGTTPPSEGQEVFRLWKGIFGLMKGLHDLHNGQDIIWHQDIKPSNILVLSSPSHPASPYHYKFKIADFSTSHLKRVISSEDDDTDRDTQGTRTYGAPECYRSDGTLSEGDIRVTYLVDVWSLGCIISEFAIWIGGGYEALNEYRQARRAAIQQIPDFQDSDCFHNGSEVLPTIKEWHEKTRLLLLETQDTITSEIFPLIEDTLQVASKRGNAHGFCTKAHIKYAEGFKSFRELFPNTLIDEDLIPGTMRRQTQRSDPPIRPQDLNMQQPVEPKISQEPASWQGVITDEPQPILAGSFTISPDTVHPPTFESIEPFPVATSSNNRPTSARFNSAWPADPESLLQRNGVRHETQAQPSRGSQPTNFQNSEEHLANQRDMSTGYELASHAPIDGQFFADVQSNNCQFSPQSRLTLPLSPGLTTPVRPSTRLPLHIHISPASDLRYSLEGTHQVNSSRIPYLGIEAAEEWREEKKASSSRISREMPELPGSWTLNALNGRNSIFVIDDAESMQKHWPAVLRLLSILAYLIKSKDKDGLDLYFTQSDKTLHANNSSGLVKCAKREMMARDKGWCDMSASLDKILSKYAARLRQEREKARGLNVYIFTDGVWNPDCDVVPEIDKIVQTILELNLSQRKIGLQFISFGDDEDGLARLNLLDNCLGLQYDIVDTTPSTGNLYKMIRGAIDRSYDEANERGPCS